jgi:hypothetical protein
MLKVVVDAENGNSIYTYFLSDDVQFRIVQRIRIPFVVLASEIAVSVKLGSP